MATRTVRRSAPANPIVSLFQAYLGLGAEAKTLTDRQGTIKKDLLDFATENGSEDPEKGHRTITLSQPVEVAGKRYTGFQKQRRVSQVFNVDRAETLCKQKGFDKDDYITTEEYVDQEKIARLYADDQLTDEEFYGLLDENVTWAFQPVKES